MNNYRKVIIGIIILILIFLLGYLLGRRTFKPKTITEIKWIPGHTVLDTIEKPTPYYVEVPSDPEYIYIEVPGQPPIVDTTAILQDWLLKRHYELILMDNDTIGFLKLYADVQYNKLQETRYEFTPIIKTVDNEIQVKQPKQLFTPFVMVGFSSNMIGSVGGGLFIKDVGLSYEYVHKFSDERFNAHALKILYKF
jgi:hypothetical protein